MKFKKTKAIAREPGVPYTMQEILLERVNFEDRFFGIAAPAPELPKTPIKKLELTPAAAFVLGRQMIRRSLSLLTP